MSNENGNEPAFAAINELGGSYQQGLTKREYFAGLAMQGMLANPTVIQIMMDAGINPDNQAEFLSIAAIEQGDSLLQELSKSKP